MTEAVMFLIGMLVGWLGLLALLAYLWSRE